ncbi:MAG: hypothetical protein ACJ8FL_02035 [Sphingomicrobium sp.]
MWTAFDYMYRDAGNFKVFGTIILEGRLGAADQEAIRSCLSSREFFIAEQVGAPPLYQNLYRWSGGPTNLDHCWHELVGFREIATLESDAEITKTRTFVSRFTSVKDWDETLSPHFALAGPQTRAGRSLRRRISSL